MDFVFDRTADGRVIKSLTIVDDATHEAVAIEVEHAISGQMLTRVLDRLALSRGLPKVIRTDNGKEFCGKAMLEWAHRRSVDLRLIEPGKPSQNAYVESFNGRFRDECLNEHWFTGLLHARTLIETWRREYNEERPKCVRWMTLTRIPAKCDRRAGADQRPLRPKADIIVKNLSQAAHEAASD